MSALTPPSAFTPSGITFRPVNVVSSSRSPFSGSTQVYRHPGAWWEWDVELPPMTRANAAVVQAFLLKLRGPMGTFLMRPYGHARRGSAAGNPVCNGAGVPGAETLAVDGFTSNATGVFLAGDFIQIGTSDNRELKMVMTDANANGSGEATLDIWPPIRVAPENGSAVVSVNPCGVFRLSPEAATEWHVDRAVHTRTAISIVEAVI